MKLQDTKNKFIEMRAEGQSYSNISKELKISKSTCSAWEKELKNEIAFLKAEQLKELYDNYFMTKKARITALGDTLKKINDELTKLDYSNIPPEKLIDYQLKYMEALKSEYIAPLPSNKIDTPEDIKRAISDLYIRATSGEVEKEQINRELDILNNLLKAYDTAELKKQLDILNNIIGGR